MPTYDYICNACKHEWDELHSIADRKTPESNPCPSCLQIGAVSQTLKHTMLTFGDPVRMGHIKPPIEFQERLQQIHDNTPGSRIADTSNITQIKNNKR